MFRVFTNLDNSSDKSPPFGKTLPYSLSGVILHKSSAFPVAHGLISKILKIYYYIRLSLSTLCIKSQSVWVANDFKLPPSI